MQKGRRRSKEEEAIRRVPEAMVQKKEGRSKQSKGERREQDGKGTRARKSRDMRCIDKVESREALLYVAKFWINEI